MAVDILGVSEIKWAEIGDIWSADYRFIYCSATNRMAGVGFLLNKRVANKVKSICGFNETIILIRSNRNLTI